VIEAEMDLTAATAPTTSAAMVDVASIVAGQDLSGARLIGADLSGRDLSGCDLSGAELSNADLSGAKLVGARLVGATLYGANLAGAVLLKADLSGADLSESNCRDAMLGGASLDGATFFHVDLSNAALSKATALGADFRAANLSDARMLEMDLRRAILERATLRGADLSGSRVDHADLTDANLERARLRDVVGYGTARWIGVEVLDVDFTRAHLLRRTILDENYLHEFANASTTRNWLFHLWRLTSDCGRSLWRWSMVSLFVAVFFAVAYTFVGIDYGDHRTALSPLYFSVVTLTTLGYGDVVPASEAAQLLVMIEVVLGHVMLGGLLSIFATRMARRAE
jgi:uncharacterized protein YjbI with pentapeptide repeats